MSAELAYLLMLSICQLIRTANSAGWSENDNIDRYVTSIMPVDQELAHLIVDRVVNTVVLVLWRYNIFAMQDDCVIETHSIGHVGMGIA